LFAQALQYISGQCTVRTGPFSPIRIPQQRVCNTAMHEAEEYERYEKLF